MIPTRVTLTPPRDRVRRLPAAGCGLYNDQTGSRLIAGERHGGRVFHLWGATPYRPNKGEAMSKQQNEEFAAKFGKLRSQIKADQLGLPDEVWAAKDKPSSRHGGFDLDSVLCGPGPRVPGKAGRAALAAAFHDVVTEGEGIEPLGLWHDVSGPEPHEDELGERGLDEDELKELLAAASFHAMLDRVRQGGGLPLTVLEECLSSCVSATDHEAKQPRRKRRAALEPKRLTARQAEIVHIVGECKGDIAEAARRLSVDRKTVAESYEVAMSKLGTTASAYPSTMSLPQDRRGQVDVSGDRRPA